MLQFLRKKCLAVKVPDGWIIAAAGNPPEYNRSVRSFDTVTLDCVKYITVEADYTVWRDYAVEKEHPPCPFYLTLSLHRADF